MRRLKVIGVTSGSGGAGKTFVATNLAVGILHQVRGGVLFLDASAPCPGDGCLKMGLPRNKSISDLLPLLDRLTPDFLSSYLMTAPSGVPCLSLVNDVVQANALNRAVLEQVFHVLDQAFDYLVMDLSLLTGDIAAFLIDRTDQVCVVVDPSPAGLARAGHLMGLLRGAQVPIAATGLCVNRTTEAHTGLGASQLGAQVLAYLADQPQTVSWAESKGHTLIELRPDDELSAGFADLSRAFIQRAFRHRAEQARESSGDAPPAEVRRGLKLRILRRLIEEIDLRKGDLGYLHDPVKRQEMHVRVEGKLVALVQEEATEVSRQDRRQLVKELMDEALGLGPLEDLLEDPTVTEIMVNRIDQVYVERKGHLTLSDVSFLSNDQLRGIIERIVAPLGRRIDEKVPMVDARLRDGSRVNAIIPPLALKGPAITIRKFSKKLLGIPDLIGFGSMTEQIATFLGAAVHARQNIVISGGTGSGKTTLLNVLSSFIPDDERIVTIEDAAELQLPQEHVVSLESRPPNIEGEGAITIRDLVRNSLRMRPDRIVVGECRGGEALDMLQAMNTGHDGSLTTLHANTPVDALSRLETLALMSGLDLPARAIRDQIASAVQLVVQQSRMQDGSRRITYVTEICGQEGTEFITRDVFRFEQTGLSPDGKVQGQFRPTGHVPAFVKNLPNFGIQVPEEIFLHQTL
jgi:septum site-determining protein MinD